MPELNVRQELFAQKVAAGVPAGRAYANVYGNTRTADAAASRLLRNVKARVAEIQASVLSQSLLTMRERREFLARIVRTPIGELDEHCPFVSARRVIRPGGETVTLELDKLKAIELDAKLAGEWIERQEIGVAGTILQVTPENRGKVLRAIKEWEAAQLAQGKQVWE